MAMPIVGVRNASGEISVAQVSGDGSTLTVLTDLETFWSAPYDWITRQARGDTMARDGAAVVAPLRPDAQFFCVGLNYRDHAAEGSYGDQALPEVPSISGRWGRSVSVDGADVPVPRGEDGLDWEGEVVAWVGRRLVDATEAEALAAVVGYSVFNDITARRAQKTTSQWLLGKNADNSGALGPLMAAADVGDVHEGLRLRTSVNGEIMQDASTRDMIHSVEAILAHISHTITLLPGDLVATGTPSGVGYARKPPRLLVAGDKVEVEIERLGKVSSTIVSPDLRRIATQQDAEHVPSPVAR
jgi:2-keto-4-pentenoate hydratase/2-oxohepta-3-ene-1,7-dioic acid hydratase in catechol pathway